ncbi:Z-ring formation inhibitor MciZ [Tepidibacillus fermentans]|uniref:Uncharacterized protein DUF3936 n=1 Tax=Tepidibacillus fermentans TaxID=1281767 RepID=A0A4R3KJV9_9BACI|nr:Z-ring formation inhibitor MciZ [Tepidibacillus fermentans]TCS84071.1 uncharacterized protein DUF3936 [Tepidibacillus fermentans]
MKVYRNQNQLRIIGKAWEIKAKLRELSQSTLTVKEYLSKFRYE